MRTKALILTAAVGAMSVASSMAQVYSVNAVGYVNVTVPAGKLALIANQLNAPTMTLGALIPSAPDGMQIYYYQANGTYDIATYDALFANAWDKPNIPLVPGGGVFASNPDAAPFVITFVGEVPQGALNNQIPNGLSIRSSIVPQSGGLSSTLLYPPADGDQCYQYNSATGQYIIRTYDGLFNNAWDVEPNIAVGEAFFIQSSGAKTWSRTFSVN
jgi:hypothetical protein